MSSIVLAMLILTIVDEIFLPKHPIQKVKTAEHFEFKALPSHLMLNVSTELYKNSPSRNLLK